MNPRESIGHLRSAFYLLSIGCPMFAASVLRENRPEPNEPLHGEFIRCESACGKSNGIDLVKSTLREWEEE